MARSRFAPPFRQPATHGLSKVPCRVTGEEVYDIRATQDLALIWINP